MSFAWSRRYSVYCCIVILDLDSLSRYNLYWYVVCRCRRLYSSVHGIVCDPHQMGKELFSFEHAWQKTLAVWQRKRTKAVCQRAIGHAFQRCFQENDGLIASPIMMRPSSHSPSAVFFPSTCSQHRQSVELASTIHETYSIPPCAEDLCIVRLNQHVPILKHNSAMWCLLRDELHEADIGHGHVISSAPDMTLVNAM